MSKRSHEAHPRLVYNATGNSLVNGHFDSMLALVSISMLTLAADPHSDGDRFLAMDNGAIRVEIDVHRSGIRFVGMPGGVNFIDSFSVESMSRAQFNTPNPSGLYSEVVFLDTGEVVTFSTPAKIVEHSPRRTVLLSTAPDIPGLRLLFEVTLDSNNPTARFVTTILFATHSARRAYARNVTRLPRGATLVGDLEPREGSTQHIQRVSKGPRPRASVERLAGAKWMRTLQESLPERAAYYRNSNPDQVHGWPDNDPLQFVQGAIGMLDVTSSLMISEEWTVELLAGESATGSSSRREVRSTP